MKYAPLIMDIISATIKGVAIIILLQREQNDLAMVLLATFTSTSFNIREKINRLPE